jgi:hypothetical protein
MLRKGVKDKNAIYKACMKNLRMFGADVILAFMAFADYDNKLQAFIQRALSMPLIEFESDFASIYVRTIDVYMLGMTMIDVMYMLKYYGNLKYKNADMYQRFTTDVLAHMIDPDPSNRMGAADFHVNLSSVLGQPPDKDTVAYMKVSDMKTILTRNNIALGTKAPTRKNMFAALVKVQI